MKTVPLGDGFAIEEDLPEAPAFVRSIFEADGPLARRFKGYSPREGQILFAERVQYALDHPGEPVIAEAPCGTGKSLGYLLPAMLRLVEQKAEHASGAPPGYYDPSKPTIMLVTAGITLTEQLVNKDLPLAVSIIEEMTGEKLTFGLLKGMNNYACQQRIAETQATVEIDPDSLHWSDKQFQQFEDVRMWADTSLTGDSSELEVLPDSKVWSSCSVSKRDCIGKSCIRAKTCFGRHQRFKAYTADIIVTNYHLLAHSLYSEVRTGVSMIPCPNILICDEIHESPDIFRDVFGGSMRLGSISALGKRLDQLNISKAEKLAPFGHALFELITRYINSGKYNGTRFLDRPKTSDPQLWAIRQAMAKLHKAVAQIQGVLELRIEESGEGMDPQTLGKHKQALGLASDIADVAHRFAIMPDNTAVYADVQRDWRDKDKPVIARDVTIKLAVVDVAPTFREMLWSRYPHVVCCSATISTGRADFSYADRLFGFPRNRVALDVPSPFDFPRQGAVILPQGLPESPNTDAFRQCLAEVSKRAVQLAGGRTLLLFTSYRNMHHVAGALVGLPYTVLKQGDAPRSRLIEKFRSNTRSVLLGVASLWTGIDVPGESLSCLLIDKLPFPNFSDPVLDVIKQQDRQWFNRYAVPDTILTLKQGIGRLIRSVDDRGVVVLCDPRLSNPKMGYSKKILRSLPGLTRCDTIELIKPILDTGRPVGELLEEWRQSQESIPW